MIKWANVIVLFASIVIFNSSLQKFIIVRYGALALFLLSVSFILHKEY